jgi:hypothetical protein
MQLIENFFNKDECDFAISEIMSYKNHWYNCAETDMFVVGNSLLRKQDFDKNGNKDYSNYLNSKDLYFKTLEIFKEKISKEFLETKFCSFLPKPGFQIINTSGSKNPAVWHYDDILTFYPYDVEFSDYKNNFPNYFESFYIFNLMLTDTQSNFDYFPETNSNFLNVLPAETPICKEHVNLVGDNCPNSSCKLKEFKSISYSRGSLLIQKDERILHRVGIRDINGKDEMRITLTGYGVVKNNVMYLYW